MSVRCFAFKIFAPTARHHDVRQICAVAMEKNVQLYQQFCNSDRDQYYIENIRRNGVWGGDIEAAILGKVLNLNVIVFDFERETGKLNFF